MQPLRVYSVVPNLPAKLKPLWELAYNLVFSWNDDIVSLFAQVDRKLWRECYGNPVLFLNRLPQRTLETLARDDFFVERVNDLRHALEAYLARANAAIAIPNGDGSPLVAYFSLEYGIAQCLPIYSGGLGILAGDHLKSASDLCVPLVGVGLCYQQGYFRQYLTPDGWQQERYPIYDFEQMPLSLCKDAAGERIMCQVHLKDEPVFAQIWKAQVGRVPLYLLDTNVPENQPATRQLTNRLYGGDLETRVRQEYLLGIGGIRALEALGLKPKVIHMNEGHSAFAGLERIANFMSRYQLPFEAAMELVASSSIFTTHTPVPAGNDRFPPDLIQAYFETYAHRLGLAFKVLLALGREDPRDDSEHFCMTVLALKALPLQQRRVQAPRRGLAQDVEPRLEPVPRGGRAHRRHHQRRACPHLGGPGHGHPLLIATSGPTGARTRTAPGCSPRPTSFPTPNCGAPTNGCGNGWSATCANGCATSCWPAGPNGRSCKTPRKCSIPRRSPSASPAASPPTSGPTCCSRTRNASSRSCPTPAGPSSSSWPARPIPTTTKGKRSSRTWCSCAPPPRAGSAWSSWKTTTWKSPAIWSKGVDVWLNTPRRPFEACGTSGMKAVCNGVLNCSTLDGWWAEAYRPDNSIGWAIGMGEEYEDAGYQDFVESQTLYNILENEIIPTFYDRGTATCRATGSAR